MAILLHEEGIYERCRIYATDMNESALRQAKIGSFRPTSLKEYTDNYERAGGKGSLADFYTMSQNHAIFRASLKDNLIFAHHNLATDGPFNEFQAIICRNVIIYFNKSLQTRVHGMLLESLVRFGFLGLGSKESLKYTPYESYYEELDPQQKLYRRIK
jgi:chemotaxis protein methyltransferase CheR